MQCITSIERECTLEMSGIKDRILTMEVVLVSISGGRIGNGREAKKAARMVCDVVGDMELWIEMGVEGRSSGSGS